MNKSKEHTPTMYESIPAVAALNRVPGFDPMKLLRRTVSPQTNEEVLRLDFPYKKLWFRLANPKGRIRLNALRITEQLAIFEAQVFLDRSDTEPIGSFTSCCTKEEAPGGQYIQAAQRAAMNEALSDAGYGLQFVDVSMDREDRRYGSEVPVQRAAEEKAVKNMPLVLSAPVQTESVKETLSQQAVTKTSDHIEKSQEPAKKLQEPAIPQEPDNRRMVTAATVGPKELPGKVEEEDSLPVPMGAVQQTLNLQDEDTLPVTAASAEQVSPSETVSETEVQAQNDAAPKYTMDTPVEQILEVMTFEEAQEVVVDTGVCNGWKIRDVAERRAASLKFYVYGGYKGKNNILRAAARITLDALTAQKAG